MHANGYKYIREDKVNSTNAKESIAKYTRANYSDWIIFYDTKYVIFQCWNANDRINKDGYGECDDYDECNGYRCSWSHW